MCKRNSNIYQCWVATCDLFLELWDLINFRYIVTSNLFAHSSLENKIYRGHNQLLNQQFFFVPPIITTAFFDKPEKFSVSVSCFPFHHPLSKMIFFQERIIARSLNSYHLIILGCTTLINMS